jgi:uncharacterized protein Yka (UPF0111/DUF47 family)
MSDIEYKCKRCKKPFPDKWKYERHLARKTPCEPILDKDYAKLKANDKKGTVCAYCNRKMSNSYALKRHYESCRAYNDGDLVVAHVMRKQKDQMKNHKKTIKDLSKEIDELKSAISNSSSLSISHVQTNYNSTNVTNNFNINGPIIFGQEQMTEFLSYILNSQEHALLVDALKNKVGNMLRKNKPLEIVSDVMAFTHDNDQLPQGKNMFMATKGKYKNMIVTLQECGWVATNVSTILAITKGEVVSVVRRIPFDPEHEKTKKCVDTFNNTEFIDHDIGPTVETSIRKFELSKNNPTKDILPFDPSIAIKNTPPPPTKLAPIEFADYEVPASMADIEELTDDDTESLSEKTKLKRKKNREYVYVPPPTQIPNYEPPKRQEDVTREDLTGFPMFD